MEEPEEAVGEEEASDAAEAGKGETDTSKEEAAGSKIREAEATAAGRGGNRHSSSWVAVAALFAVGAFVLRERDILSPSVGTTPTPAVTGAAQAGENVPPLEVDAKGAVTSTPAPTAQASGLLPEGFVPIEDEPEETVANPETETASSEILQELLPGFVPEEAEVLPEYDAMELYIVQSGDTLAGICKRYYGDISRMEEVKGVNQIPDENWIYAGQELYLP